MPRHPAEISPEAQAWLDNPLDTEPGDLSAQALPGIRAEMRRAAQPVIDGILAETGATCRKIDLAGVPCLEVTPPNADKARTILYGFGGGYTVGSPDEDLPITARLAVETRATLIAPYYRLSPEHLFPAALEDIMAVARALLAGEATVAFAGESAGANLVLAAIHRLRAADEAPPVAVALMSPATDLAVIGDSFDIARDPSLTPARVTQVPAIYAPGHDLTNPDLSPIFGAFDADFPPLIATTGTRDLFLSQSARLARVMREAGAEIDLRVWEGMWHVFEFYPDLPEARASIREIGAFLNARLG